MRIRYFVDHFQLLIKEFYKQSRRRISIAKERWYTYKYTRCARHISQSCGTGLKVNAKCIFQGKIFLGDNCNFNGMQVLGNGTVHFGNNFHSGKECMIITSNHNFDFGNAIPYDNTFILKKITIEDNVWLGNRVTIVGNVTIGEGAIVGAGSVVVKDIPPCAIVGGNPAKIIRYRDVSHYNNLKKIKSFL